MNHLPTPSPTPGTTPQITHTPKSDPINISDHPPRWPHRIAILFVIMTFILITYGGAVTSYNAGMAVPDWPTSFGKWFVIPLNLWADFAVSLEHNHRLTGAISGLIAIAMLLVTGLTYGIRHRITALAGIALLLYIAQGIMGGIRVIDINTTWAIIHGISGQLIFCFVIALAAVTSQWWHDPKSVRPPGMLIEPYSRTTRTLCLALFAILVIQLTLGALVRHTQSASAIPDAPAAYGQFIPPFNTHTINQQFHPHGGHEWFIYSHQPALSMDAVHNPQTPRLLEHTARIPAPIPKPWQVAIHFAHRLGAIVVTLLIITVLTLVLRQTQTLHGLRGPAITIMILLPIQLLLGLSVIWSRENSKIATGHQVVGALLLGTTALFLLRTYRLGRTLKPTDPIDMGPTPSEIPQPTNHKPPISPNNTNTIPNIGNPPPQKTSHP